MCLGFPDTYNAVCKWIWTLFMRLSVGLSGDVCDAFSLAFTHAICACSALTLGRRRSSRSSWCRGRPPSCQTWAGSGGWRQRSHNEKPGPRRARCQCSGHTRSHSLAGCHTCEEDRECLNITLSPIMNRIFTLLVARHIWVHFVCSTRHWQASS